MKQPGEGYISLRPSGKRIRAQAGLTLLELLRREGIAIHSGCGGAMKCGRCVVDVDWSSEPLPPPTAQERAVLGDKAPATRRLACGLEIRGSAEIRIPSNAESGPWFVLTDSYGLRKASLKPAVTACAVETADPRQGESVLACITSDLKYRCGVEAVSADPFILRGLSRLYRTKEKAICFALARNGEIVGVFPGTDEGLFGIAFDMGTTTIAGFLMNLRSGQLEAVSSSPNPQIPFGDDVVTRLTYCCKHGDGAAKLQRLLVDALNRMVLDAASVAQIVPERIVDATVVGNTAMHHLLLGLDPTSLSIAPYRPITKLPLDIKARDLGLGISPSAYVHVPQPVAGYVGSDAVAGVIATSMNRTKTPSLLIDLGTNGEILLGDAQALYACSTAAGPVFEGGHIRHGVRAVAGAIDRVEIDPETLVAKVRTIGGKRPLGICGSGAVSTTAALIRAGILRWGGGLVKREGSARIRSGPNGMEFILASASESATGEEIVINEADLSQIQLAKAAICAGATLLWERAGRPQIQKIYLAGAGGSSIEPEDAALIGLIPDFPQSRVRPVGNAAGKGACLFLSDHRIRKEAQRTAERINHVELSGLDAFDALFVDSMPFRKAKDWEE